MRWELNVRPPSNVCPEHYCFHWVTPGGKSSPPGRVYSSREEMFRDSVNWPEWPNGGCGCTFGVCRLADPVAGTEDWYEPHEPRLERDGLPWFYFSTYQNLSPEFHERFLQEAVLIWGEAVLVETTAPPLPPTTLPRTDEQAK